jgi:adenosylcobinamide amidohydrolase
MLLTKLCTGEEVHRYKKSIVVFFKGRRKVLSTSPHNGGYREDIAAAFNNDCTVGAGMAATLLAPTYAEHMALLSTKLGLDPAASVGISTAAQMENLSIKAETYKAAGKPLEITVTALVTGGVEVNGGRAADPASWDELAHLGEAEGMVEEPSHGTINIILHINVNLTEGALARALVTCTEAKTAALQELLAASRYSQGLATGSGTDGTIIVANADSAILLNNAGKHCKLGELIGRSVKAAVKEALLKQSGLGPEKQRHVLRRVDRFGVTEDSLWERHAQSGGAMNRAEFAQAMDEKLGDPMLVTLVSLYAHLIDQLSWGLIAAAEANAAAQDLLRLMGASDAAETKDGGETADAINRMIENLSAGLLKIAAGKGAQEL